MGRRRCTCAGCTAFCGTCVMCLDKYKFGGGGKKKKACLMRQCVAGVGLAEVVGVVEQEVPEVQDVREVQLQEVREEDFTAEVEVQEESEDQRPAKTSALGIEFTQQDYEMVRAVHSHGSKVMRLLVESLCPSIYGHELVKAGLLLGLFGGATKSTTSGVPVRGDPHILVVGDPGLGKSQMLQAVVAVAPRGVMVTGNTSTAGGLTVTLTREAGNDFSLDAGALVLADQGCCCIDEFDKMSGQHGALLEAMEQQTISVAKGGVVCTLPARTAILAAANPSGGHYNKTKTVAENLKMGPALLSRFDLVFILIDKVDKEQDERLSEHVMALHSREGATSVPQARRGRRAPAASEALATQGTGQLADNLKSLPGEEADPLPPHCLMKYIAYARRYVHPSLGEEAKQVLQDFYLQLRAKPQAEGTPITTRQLESLIRLTEARARLELREEATEQDALQVVEIMRSSMATEDYTTVFEDKATYEEEQIWSLLFPWRSRRVLHFENFHSIRTLKVQAYFFWAPKV